MNVRPRILERILERILKNELFLFCFYSYLHKERDVEGERERGREQSAGAARIGRWRESEILPLEEELDLAEERPFGGQATPALAHQVVDIARAVSRTAQRHGRRRRRRPLRVQVEVLHDAVVVQLIQRALPRQHQDLPQCHSERPHVTLRCVFAL